MDIIGGARQAVGPVRKVRMPARVAAAALLVLVQAGGMLATGAEGALAGPLAPTAHGTALPGGPASLLFGLRCITAADCWAVGESDPKTEALHWNGHRWSQVPTPSPGDSTNTLDDVACTSDANCWAVGTAAYQNETAPNLVLHWNGHRWRQVPAPTPVPQGVSELWSVSCISAASCWAVGQTSGGGEVLRWDGHQWSLFPGLTVEPTAVHCAPSGVCWIVGSAGTAGVGLRWNGQQWSYAPVPGPPSTLSALSAVACTSAANCWAVGDFTGSAGHAGGGQALHWNGHAWVMWEQ